METEDGAAVLGGGVIGVFLDKVIGDLFLAGNIPNPEYMHLQLHDAILITGELIGAALTPSPINSILVGMAGAVIVTDVYENVRDTGQWFALTLKKSYVQKGFMRRLSH